MPSQHTTPQPGSGMGNPYTITVQDDNITQNATWLRIVELTDCNTNKFWFLKLLYGSGGNPTYFFVAKPPWLISNRLILVACFHF